MDINNALGLLNSFASDPLFVDKFALAFGITITPEQYLTALTSLPEIEVRTNAELQGALGAFSAQTGKIYLSQSLIQGSVSQYQATVIEEIGHYLDHYFNGNADSDGDEGDIFSRLVRGETIDQTTLQGLKAENDHATITLDGQVIAVEQALDFTDLDSSETYFKEDGDEEDNYFYENVQTYQSATGGQLDFRARFKNILLPTTPGLPGFPPGFPNVPYTKILPINYATSLFNDTSITTLDSTEKGLLIHTSQDGSDPPPTPNIWSPTDVANLFAAQLFVKSLGSATGTNTNNLVAEDTFKGTPVNLGTLSRTSSSFIKVTLVWTGAPADLDLKLQVEGGGPIYTPSSLPPGASSFVGTDTVDGTGTVDLIPNTPEYIEQIFIPAGALSPSDTRFDVTVGGNLNGATEQDFSIFFSVQGVVGNGHGWGDVHLQTFDGKAYEFQTVGEFILVKSLIDDFQVQTRQEASPFWTSASVNTAFAINLGGYNFQYDIDLPATERLSVDGLTFNLQSGKILNLGINQVKRQGNEYVFTYGGPDAIIGTSDDDTVIASVYEETNDTRRYFISLYVDPADYRSGLLQGLLGDGDGFTDNDFALRDGTNLGLNPAPREINRTVHTTFADSWRITQEESLFGTPVFQDPSFPTQYINLDTLRQQNPQAVANAINLVRAAGIPQGAFFDGAVFDFVVTGDKTFITGAAKQAQLNKPNNPTLTANATINITPSTTPNGFVINPNANNTDLLTLGWVVKGNGDFNGDGKKDFIVAAPGAYLGTGSLYVVFGSTNLATSPILELNYPFSVNGSLAIGDINGDQKDDIIIGDPNADQATSQGKTYVVFGNSTIANIQTNPNSLNGTNGFTIINSDNGSNIGDLLGWSVSSGKIDGDNFDDIIIGDPNANNYNGEVFVVFGKGSAFPSVFDLSTASTPTDILRIQGTSLAQSGFSVGSGNIGGTSQDDIIIGGPLAGGLGETKVIFGNSSRGNIGTNSLTLTTTTPDTLGWKVASAGNINGDQYEDLIVTAPFGSTNQRTYIVFGQSTFTSNLLNVITDIQNGNGSKGFYIDGLNADDFQFEAISAAGDVNNDGIDDLLIAEPLNDTNSLADSGKVYVVFGRNNFGTNPSFNLGNLTTTPTNQGFVVNISGLTASDNTGYSVSDGGDINGDGIGDFLIGAPGANGTAGKVYVVLGKDTSKPIPDTTVNLNPSYFYPSGYYPLIGEKHTFIVSFDNIAQSPGNVGYAPFVNLYLDTTGTDGVAPGSSSPVDNTYDGLTLIPNGIRYILDQDISSVVVNGQTVTDGLHSVPLNLLGIQPLSAIIYDDDPTAGVNLVVDHPYAGKIAAPSGFNAGDTLYVIPLPQGSFTPDQPVAQLEVDVQISNKADYNQPLKIATSGGFRLGGNPVLDAGDPVLDTTLTNDNLNPLLYRIRKTGPYQTVTGPNFARQYNIGVDIAPGQTIGALKLQDILPPNAQFLSVVAPSTIVPPAPTSTPGGTLVSNLGTAFGNPNTSTDAQLNFNFYIPRLYDADGNTVITNTEDVINRQTGAPVTSKDAATVDPSLTWNPLDGRDIKPTTLVEPSASWTTTDVPIAIQKGWDRVLPTGDIKAPGLSPGDTIEYTLNFQVSDYFAFGNLKIADIFSDGQVFDTTFAPTFSITEHNSTVNGTFTGANYTVINPGSNGTINFNLSSQLALLPAGSNPNDKLLGGYIGNSGGYLPPAYGVPNNPAAFGATTGTIKFRTKIQEDFTTNFPSGDKSVDNGDYFSNSATITGDILNVEATGLPSYGTTQSASSGTAFLLPRGSFDDYQVSVYQIKRGNTILPGTTNTVFAGDEVTYRVKYVFPFGDIENLKFTSYLPLPVLGVGGLDTSQIYSGLPTLGKIVSTTGNSGLNPVSNAQPIITIDGASNALTINYGTFDDPNTAGPKTIDLLYTLKVGTQPTENNLTLNNLVYESEGSTNAGSRTFVKNAQLKLAQSEVNITKGVVATSENNAVFSSFFPVVAGTPQIKFNNPGTTGQRFTGVINSNVLNPVNSSNHFNSDVTANLSNTTAPEPDLVTFAIILENNGTSPNGAFDVLIKDTLPTGFTIPTAGLNLRAAYGNGTTIPITSLENSSGGTAIPIDLFGGGIRLKDGTQGAIGAYNATSGNNVVVITYDLAVNDGLAQGTTITNTATLEEYSNSEGGTKFLPGTQSVTDDAKVRTQSYLQDQFNTFRSSRPVGVGGNILAGGTFDALDYLGGNDLTYKVVVKKGALTVYDSTVTTNNSPLNPFSSIDPAALAFSFRPSLGGTFTGTYTVTVDISDADTTNNPSSTPTYDVRDTFTFIIQPTGTVVNDYIAGATVFFDVNKNERLDNNELFTTTDEQGNFTFEQDLLVYDTNGNGTLDISEGQLVSIGGINTATGLAQETPLIASPDGQLITPLTTIITGLIEQGLTQTQANDVLANALSIPNTINLSNFDPITAVNNNEPNAVAVYKVHEQIAILTAQIAAIAAQNSNQSQAQVIQNVVTAIANQVNTGVPLDLTNATQLTSIISNATGITNTNLVEGTAQIIAAANQTISDFAANSPIGSIEQQFAQVQKVALGETQQDLEAVIAGAKTITQAIAENTGTALSTQIAAAQVLSANPTDITLSSDSVAEVKPIGTQVGTFSTVDPDTGETHTYTLVSGEGDTDNAQFTIAGNVLKTLAVFDYETQTSYSIRVQSADGNGGLFQKALTINIADVNEINGTPGRDTLTGTPNNDIITGFQGNDVLTGNGGNDQFVYTSLTDAGDTIKDFTVGEDKIVLTQLLSSLGYSGSNPIADGYVQFTAQGSNSSFLRIDADGLTGSSPARPFIFVENVPLAALNVASNFVC